MIENSKPGYAAVIAMLAAACLSMSAQAAGYETAASGAPKQTLCNGMFSDGSTINVSAPKNMTTLPSQESFCDFHTFSWNQFIYLTQTPGNTPAFLQLAPWYNLLRVNGAPKPGPYPGGDTSLKGGTLSKGQAGTDAQLVDVAGGTVLYDIRFNQAMYDGIANGGLYSQAGFQAACAPDTNGNCTKPIWLPPVNNSNPNAQGALEVKTSWRDFGAPGRCPADFYCNGRFGLVGMHLVQKTVTHGEWIWASFEHVANAPDCAPGGDETIAQRSPLGSPWSFFSPASAGSGVMNSKVCSVKAGGQCNTDPAVAGTNPPQYKQVNICRTSVLPPGGNSAKNCFVNNNSPTQATANNAGNVACLNATFQPQMKGVWKNYKMIGALWIKGTTAPNTQFRIQGFQTQVPGMPFGQPVGFPNMANTTMETWLQPQSTSYDPFGTNTNQAGCFLCHNLPAGQGSADLSHFPGKLPTAKLNKFLESLISAQSSEPAKK